MVLIKHTCFRNIPARSEISALMTVLSKKDVRYKFLNILSHHCQIKMVTYQTVISHHAFLLVHLAVQGSFILTLFVKPKTGIHSLSFICLLFFFFFLLSFFFCFVLFFFCFVFLIREITNSNSHQFEPGCM